MQQLAGGRGILRTRCRVSPGARPGWGAGAVAGGAGGSAGTAPCGTDGPEEGLPRADAERGIGGAGERRLGGALVRRGAWDGRGLGCGEGRSGSRELGVLRGLAQGERSSSCRSFRSRVNKCKPARV